MIQVRTTAVSVKGRVNHMLKNQSEPTQTAFHSNIVGLYSNQQPGFLFKIKYSFVIFHQILYNDKHKQWNIFYNIGFLHLRPL